jgi:hypothetical protein
VGARLLTLGRAAALQIWKASSFKQRKMLLKVLQKYIIGHQEEICRCAAAAAAAVGQGRHAGCWPGAWALPLGAAAAA